MDPQQAMVEFLRALEQREEEEALQYAFSLLKWLDRGGFAPKLGEAIHQPDWLDPWSPLAVRIRWLNENIQIQI